MYRNSFLAVLVFAVGALLGRSVLVGADPASEASNPNFRLPLIPYATELAKAKREALRADPKDLARARFEAVRMESNDRFKEFLAGRGTLDFLLEAAFHYLEAELAISEQLTDRLTAYERYWSTCKEIELIDQGRYDAGRIPIQDLLRSKSARLQAEIWWLEARASKGTE